MPCEWAIPHRALERLATTLDASNTAHGTEAAQELPLRYLLLALYPVLMQVLGAAPSGGLAGDLPLHPVVWKLPRCCPRASLPASIAPPAATVPAVALLGLQPRKCLR